MPDRLTENARSGLAVLDWQAHWSPAYLRLRDAGMSQDAAWFLVTNGLAPVSWEAPCTWRDLGRPEAAA